MLVDNSLPLAEYAARMWLNDSVFGWILFASNYNSTINIGDKYCELRLRNRVANLFHLPNRRSVEQLFDCPLKRRIGASS
jgi:hypothetical protein